MLLANHWVVLKRTLKKLIFEEVVTKLACIFSSSAPWVIRRYLKRVLLDLTGFYSNRFMKRHGNKCHNNHTPTLKSEPAMATCSYLAWQCAHLSYAAMDLVNSDDAFSCDTWQQSPCFKMACTDLIRWQPCTIAEYDR